ncbi:trypsin, alkaline C-like [Anticarsia gemmatalis]|uniref:trypsin, alkaline C-like n=1 Tax=Anticarsia gemmatalis TaxID=129554 RepID=UPI003F770D9A
MRFFIVLALCCAAVSAVPRIIGGSVTTVDKYPSIVAVLQSVNHNFVQTCAGSILTRRSILSAARCFMPANVSRYRIRAGSSQANSGGTVYSLSEIFNHPNYNGLDSDISVSRVDGEIIFSNVVRAAPRAGPNYMVRDNEQVWAAGWGAFSLQNLATHSEDLRHVQMWSINQDICRERIDFLTDNMLCAGWLDVGGRDTCSGDMGGPLFDRHGVLVGVTSYGNRCADPRYPGVYVRVTSFTSWITARVQSFAEI